MVSEPCVCAGGQIDKGLNSDYFAASQNATGDRPTYAQWWNATLYRRVAALPPCELFGQLYSIVRNGLLDEMLGWIPYRGPYWFEESMRITQAELLAIAAKYKHLCEKGM